MLCDINTQALPPYISLCIMQASQDTLHNPLLLQSKPDDCYRAVFHEPAHLLDRVLVIGPLFFELREIMFFRTSLPI